jgi:quercetin dioxygenase-like cupin family protein
MLYLVTAIVTPVVLMLCAATAQTSEAAKLAPVRTVLAKAIVPNTAGNPLYFKLLRVEMGPGQAVPAAESEGMLYILTGGPISVITTERRTLVASGEALFLPGRSDATLEAAEHGTVTFLQILLGASADLDRVSYGAKATVTELYRTPASLAGLGVDALTFDVTRVTSPPHMPANPPHHRSGDALYFVLSGTGEFTTNGTVASRPPGTPHFEPSGSVHQWANPGDSPLILLVTNVTREGTPAIVSDALQPSK